MLNEIKKGKFVFRYNEYNMNLGTSLMVVFLCLLNVSFMIAGIFLNSVVIISFWRSSQLRKKLCYFMILVLSCFDLAVVIITHPLLICSTISVFLFQVNPTLEQTRFYVSSALQNVSVLALLTLNIERYLALKFPFFHQTSVTKKRMIFLLCSLLTCFIILIALPRIIKRTLIYRFIMAYFSMILLIFVYLNYETFIIAKSKRSNEIVAIRPDDQEERKPKFSYETFSSCSLVVASFFVCSCPSIALSVLSQTSLKTQSFYDKGNTGLYIWASTFLSINSTFNCLIFFWKNSTLRREGTGIMKHMKCKIM